MKHCRKCSTPLIAGENISEGRLNKTRDYKCNPCTAEDSRARYYRDRGRPVPLPKKPKHCSKCDITLTIGVNWADYRVRQRARICKTCDTCETVSTGRSTARG